MQQEDLKGSTVDVALSQAPLRGFTSQAPDHSCDGALGGYTSQAPDHNCENTLCGYTSQAPDRSCDDTLCALHISGTRPQL